MAAKELQKAVQTAVSLSVKEQQTTDRAKSFVVVYGFPEDGDDHRELLRMLDYLQCHWIVISHTRIGYVANHHTKAARRPRPIKVEFKSPYDISSIL